MHLINVFVYFYIQHYKNRKICLKAISELSTTKNRIGKLILDRFYRCFCLDRYLQYYAFLGLYCDISAYTHDYELKFSIQAKFDPLILNLK